MAHSDRTKIEKLSETINCMFKEADHKALHKEYNHSKDPVTKQLLFDSYVDMFGALDKRLEKSDKEARTMSLMIDRVRSCLKSNKRDKKLEKKLNKHVSDMVEGLDHRRENVESILDNLDYLREYVVEFENSNNESFSDEDDDRHNNNNNSGYNFNDLPDPPTLNPSPPRSSCNSASSSNLSSSPPPSLSLIRKTQIFEKHQ